MMRIWLLVLAAAATATDPSERAWQLAHEEDGIRVWTRAVASSPVREVRAQTVVAASRERIWAMLHDIPSLPQYMPYVLHSEVLERLDDATQYEYHLIDPPFVSQRDYAVRVTDHAPDDAETWERRWTAAPERAPAPKDGIVRLLVVDGAWILRRVDEHATQVTYLLHTDPGGAIPAWLANRANTTSLPDLMRAVSRRAIDPSWKP